MTIVHHAGKAGVRPKMSAQDAYARMQHARKHFGLIHRAAYSAALGLGFAVRRSRPSGITLAASGELRPAPRSVCWSASMARRSATAEAGGAVT
jgi:hypothetical protein